MLLLLISLVLYDSTRPPPARPGEVSEESTIERQKVHYASGGGAQQTPTSGSILRARATGRSTKGGDVKANDDRAALSSTGFVVRGLARKRAAGSARLSYGSGGFGVAVVGTKKTTGDDSEAGTTGRAWAVSHHGTTGSDSARAGRVGGGERSGTLTADNIGGGSAVPVTATALGKAGSSPRSTAS